MLLVHRNDGRALIWRKIFSWTALLVLAVAVTSVQEGSLLFKQCSYVGRQFVVNIEYLTLLLQ